MRTTVLTAVLLGSLGASPPIRDSDFKVTDIRAQFLYERTGTLSVDLTATPDFAIWNTVIGEGSAKEPADDLLVSAVVSGPGQWTLTTPLVITVRGENDKVLASRTITNGFADKTFVRAVMAKDVACVGPIQLEARLGKSVRQETLNMACDE